MQRITIYQGNPATGYLTLSDRGFTVEPHGGEVQWIIDNGSNVQSIEIVKKVLPPSDNIFIHPPAEQGHSGMWAAQIRPGAPAFNFYAYTIKWRLKDGQTDPDPDHPVKEYDPIIAVRPSAQFIPKLLVFVLVGLCAASTMYLFSVSKDKKMRPKH